MYRVKIAFDTSTLDAVHDLAQTLPERVKEVAKKDIRPFVSQEVDKRLRIEPPPRSGKVRWTPSRHAEDANKKPNTSFGYYSRQKAAFFAKNGFGHGIPYQRTHQLVRSWQVRGDYTDSFSGITVSNTAPAAMFVVGPWQQGFHQDTGWPSAGNELQIISDLAEDRLRLAWARLFVEMHKMKRQQGAMR